MLVTEPAVQTAGSVAAGGMFWRGLIAIGLFLLTAESSLAHDPGLSSAKVVLQGSTVHATLTFAPGDIDAISNGEKPNPDQLRLLAEDSLEIWFDSKLAHREKSEVRPLSNKDVEFNLFFEASPANRLRIRSTLLDRLPFGHRQYFTLVNAQGTTLVEKLLSDANNEVEVSLGQTALASAPPSHPFSEFLVMGIKHILTGYDHLLFLFALLIGCKRISSIVKIITAFTIAHSISLALATLGWIEIPSRVVEPLIAATIVYIALENLFKRQAVAHRVWLTFGFGLVHGFGFASALREMGVGANGSAVAVPLLAFNSGVEIGQMMVAAVILPVIWHFKDKPQFNLRWAPACSLAVAMAGAFWFVQRVWMN
jgi:hydrogenase/urease accessory protein HupE